MTFENENTFSRMKNAGKENEFHSRYEQAVANVRKGLGASHTLFIGGKGVTSTSTFEVRSPSDRNVVVGAFQSSSKKEVAMAVEAASASFDKWSRTDYKKRVAVVLRAAEIAEKRKFELAALMSIENGKNRYESVADVDEAIDFMRYYSELMTINKGYRLQMGSSSAVESNVSVLKPYGVWGVISPFNFPLAISTGMSTGAIITGNTAVLKPASTTPTLSYMLHEIYREAGLPAGVLNFITGPGGTVGNELVTNGGVAGIAFTGSREVGLSSMRRFTEKTFKPFIAELGGKNVVIVTAKADVDKAVEGTAKAAFGYGGQKCSAASRVLVNSKLKNEFVKKLVAFTKTIRIGDPTVKDTYLGPLITSEAVSKYEAAVLDANESGKVLAGGRVLRDGALARGNFVEPTVVDGLPFDNRLFTEELFLPFLVVGEIDTLDEGLEIANSVDYGLTSGIFSSDQKELEEFFSSIQAGVSYSNKQGGATTGAMVGAQPFVGWKMSGSTGKGAGGLYYLTQFMREQTQSMFS